MREARKREVTALKNLEEATTSDKQRLKRLAWTLLSWRFYNNRMAFFALKEEQKRH